MVGGLVRRNPEGLNPFVRGFDGPGLSGLYDLSPESPLIQALARRPVAEGVPHHVVVGEVRGRWPGGTDGVVPHRSSRMEAAESTLVVEGAGHGVLEDPTAVREVPRVLRLHAGAGRGAKAPTPGPPDGSRR